MANSPSEKWENGRLVKRNIETNRWTVPDDNAELEESAGPPEEDPDVGRPESFRDRIETKPARKVTKK